jgi:hypothetical protein
VPGDTLTRFATNARGTQSRCQRSAWLMSTVGNAQCRCERLDQFASVCERVEVAFVFHTEELTRAPYVPENLGGRFSMNDRIPS